MRVRGKSSVNRKLSSPAGGAQTAALCLLSVLAERRRPQLRETFDPNWPTPGNPAKEISFPSPSHKHVCWIESGLRLWQRRLHLSKWRKYVKERLELREFQASRAGSLWMLTDGKVIAYWIIFIFLYENLRLAQYFFFSVASRSRPQMNLGRRANHKLIPCHSVYFCYIKCNCMWDLRLQKSMKKFIKITSQRSVSALSNGCAGKYKRKRNQNWPHKSDAHMKPLWNSNRLLRDERSSC